MRQKPDNRSDVDRGINFAHFTFQSVSQGITKRRNKHRCFPKLLVLYLIWTVFIGFYLTWTVRGLQQEISSYNWNVRTWMKTIVKEIKEYLSNSGGTWTKIIANAKIKQSKVPLIIECPTAFVDGNPVACWDYCLRLLLCICTCTCTCLLVDDKCKQCDNPYQIHPFEHLQTERKAVFPESHFSLSRYECHLFSSFLFHSLLLLQSEIQISSGICLLPLYQPVWLIHHKSKLLFLESWNALISKSGSSVAPLCVIFGSGLKAATGDTCKLFFYKNVAQKKEVCPRGRW